MLLTENPWTATTATAPPPTAYALRLHGGIDQESLIPIPPGKHSVGSGPRCSLRLKYKGIRPLECLIVCDGAGLRVRRWADGLLVNGLPVDTASLEAGDVLSLGPVDLLVVVPGQDEFTTSVVDESAEAKPASVEQNEELAGTASDLEHTVETTVAESEQAEHNPIENDIAEESRELPQQQLSAQELELAHARYSVDVLERQLIGSQHKLNEFLDEQVAWHEQTAELDARLAECLARIETLVQQLDETRSAKSAEPTALVATHTDWAVESPSLGEARNDLVHAEIADAKAAWQETEQLSEEFASEDGEQAATPCDMIERTESFLPETPVAFNDEYSHSSVMNETRPEPSESPPPSASLAQQPPADDHHEESVERYMAKLLERMRGVSSTGSASATPADAVCDKEASLQSAVDVDTSVELETPNYAPPAIPAEKQPKLATPELASDREAMRALANQSARHAIGVHTARALRRKALTRCIVCLLSATVGLYLLIDQPNWQSVQCAAGCVATISALYWGWLTFAALIKGLQVGAFEHFDPDFDPKESLNPPLPIDVKR